MYYLVNSIRSGKRMQLADYARIYIPMKSPSFIIFYQLLQSNATNNSNYPVVPAHPGDSNMYACIFTYQ